MHSYVENKRILFELNFKISVTCSNDVSKIIGRYNGAVLVFFKKKLNVMRALIFPIRMEHSRIFFELITAKEFYNFWWCIGLLNCKKCWRQYLPKFFRNVFKSGFIFKLRKQQGSSIFHFRAELGGIIFELRKLKHDLLILSFCLKIQHCLIVTKHNFWKIDSIYCHYFWNTVFIL
jgi:hypothetical protein